MAILKYLYIILLCLSSSVVWAHGTCAPHLEEKNSDKIVVDVERLNPFLLSEKTTPEQLYIDLKNEEALWYRDSYVRHEKSIDAQQKQRILENYSLDLSRMQNEFDFTMFYLNQLRVLYVRASNQIYERILSASLGSVVTPKIKGYAKYIVNSFFSHELTSVEMRSEHFQKVMKQAPWLFFPWLEMEKITTAWEAKPVKGPRELDAFIFEMKQQFEGKFTPEQWDRIASSLRARDSIKPLCCKSGIGCQNCPLNRRFLL